jgi:hypothetical protein
MLPNIKDLLQEERECRTVLQDATRTRVLRNLGTTDEEKASLLANHRPTGQEGIGRVGGPSPADRYTTFLSPAFATLDALEKYEQAIAAAETLLVEHAAAFDILDTAVRAADNERNEILDPARVEYLLDLRRSLDAARHEHAGLVDDLENARPFRRSFQAKAERVRDAAVSVIHEQIVSDLRAALDNERQRVAAIHAYAPEAVAPVRGLVARWAARTGQPVRVPKIKWPVKGGAFDPPVLEAAE